MPVAFATRMPAGFHVYTTTDIFLLDSTSSVAFAICLPAGIQVTKIHIDFVHMLTTRQTHGVDQAILVDFAKLLTFVIHMEWTTPRV